MNLFTKQNRLTDLEKELMVARRLGGWRMERRDSQGVWDGHVHTAILKMDDQEGPAVQHRELCSMLCDSLDGRGVQGRMGTCICMSESLCCPPETITTLLIGYTSIQNKVRSQKNSAQSNSSYSPVPLPGNNYFQPVSNFLCSLSPCAQSLSCV